MKKYLDVLFVVLAVSIFTGCASDSDVESEVSEEGDTDSSNDVVISYVDDLVSLDPHGSNDAYSNRIRSGIYMKVW